MLHGETPPIRKISCLVLLKIVAGEDAWALKENQDQALAQGITQQTMATASRAIIYSAVMTGRLNWREVAYVMHRLQIKSKYR